MRKERLVRTLLALLLCCVFSIEAQASKGNDLLGLKAEMLKYISSSDREKFMSVTEQLKDKSQQTGDERMYYTAWGNQAIYEATHQYYTQALAVSKEIGNYARQHNSRYGEYMALHTEAVTKLQMQDYDEAEEAFQRTVDYWHRHFPKESAAEDIQELMKIANHRRDAQAGIKYARQILAEPNVAPIHKGRALFRLSQMAYNKHDVSLFNTIYQRMDSLKHTTGIGTREPVVEVNYLILNGRYDEALKLCDQLSGTDRMERLAQIYHLKGDNDKAYEYMVKFKKMNDSIVLVSHGNVVASCYVQMNNERMKLEQELLKNDYNRLRNKYYAAIAVAVLVLLILLILQRQHRVKSLKSDNEKLDEARQVAEDALDVKNEFIANITKQLREPLNPITGFSDIMGNADYQLQPEEREAMSRHIKDSSKVLQKLIDEMAELSFYESKNALPLNGRIYPNILGNHMVDSLRTYCKEGVKMRFTSDVADDKYIISNMDGMEHLLKHLLENSIQFTDRGAITLDCRNLGDRVRFSVTDTGCGVPESRQQEIFNVFSEADDNPRLNGMGLSICQAILRHLGGRLTLDTSYTEGARFSFELPIAKG